MDVSGTCVSDTGPFLETFTFLIKVKHTSCAGCKGGCLIYILVTGLNRQPAPKQQEKHMHALRHYLIITETSFITLQYFPSIKWKGFSAPFSSYNYWGIY